MSLEDIEERLNVIMTAPRQQMAARCNKLPVSMNGRDVWKV